MRRFTLTPDRIQGDRVTFDREETRHMTAVLRLGPGDLVVAGDGRGHDYTVRLDALTPTATGTILAVTTTRVESPLALTLVQGVPKGDKMELIVRAATELGALRIVPALAARTIVRLEPSRWRERARRWQRVAKEAAKQCGRSVVPDVEVPRPLGEGLETIEASLRLCLWEGEAPALAEVLDAVTAPPPTIAVVIGPEGGLARAEVDLARARGWQIARLGPRILRTETAGPAILAIVQFRFGDLAAGHA
ncbi:MAG: 16S rRNA (uracil(1498)-N(3))-methyltransferase [Candidatus Rokubacteria bacterium]|nr:16S rRNA (uracil(1498)-N(3))-methyltransferase [Candidatus Rokubacteria bacterium]